MISLRDINEDNFKDCIALKTDVTNDHFVDTVAYSLAEAWLHYDTIRPFAVYQANELIGYVSMNVEADNYQIINFFLSATKRGQGLGKAVVQQCTNYLKDHGAQAIAIQVDPDNTPAQKFWRKMGFEHTGKMQDGYEWMENEM